MDDAGRAYAIGMFDGVHAGHREMLSMAREAAVDRQPVLPLHVLTFHPHPRSVLTGSSPGLLCSLEQRIELLSQAGVAAVEVQAFTTEFAGTEPERFIDDFLVGKLHARVVVVGANFRFGHRARGDVDLLISRGHAAGIDVRVCDLRVDHGQVVSSSRIRDMLATRNVEGASRLLGRHYNLDGTVVHGARRGRTLGYPTANLDVPADRLIPADGVYAGIASVQTPRGNEQYGAAISIGTNPQFDPGGTSPRSVEAYLLDFVGEDALYGQHLQLEFSGFVRGQATFSTVDELVAQMDIDVERIRRHLRDGTPLRAG